MIRRKGMMRIRRRKSQKESLERGLIENFKRKK